jgi:hypothetical protein
MLPSALEDGSFEQQPPYMDDVDMNGLMGPVRLLPHWHVHLTVDTQSSKAEARRIESTVHQ